MDVFKDQKDLYEIMALQPLRKARFSQFGLLLVDD